MNKYLTSAWKLFYLQLAAHIGLVFYIFTANWQDWLVSISIYCFVACFGLVVTYHRQLGHKSWPTSKFTYYFGCITGALAGIGSPLEWTAVHRAHHRFVDTPKDPHGPEYLGFWRVQLLGMFAARQNNDIASFVVDMFRSKFHKHVARHYYRYHLALAVVLLSINVHLALMVYFVPAALCWQFGSLVNTVNHIWGYKNTVNDKHHATNNFLTGFLFFGDGWHANHHDNPTSYTTHVKWWEFDLSGIVIKLIRKV